MFNMLIKPKLYSWTLWANGLALAASVVTILQEWVANQDASPVGITMMVMAIVNAILRFKTNSAVV